MCREFSKIHSNKELSPKMMEDIKDIVNRAINKKAIGKIDMQNEFISKYPEHNVELTVTETKENTPGGSVYTVKLGNEALEQFKKDTRKVSEK